MTTPSGAVFLSYASEDWEAAQRIADTLKAAGIEVWFDQSELRGGDAWDAAIRRQIKACALFVPIISLNTNTRTEGYFRLEWKLAVDRSHLMPSDHPFLLPVAIDDTPESSARVPDRFIEVQWVRAQSGVAPAGFVEHVAKLLAAARDGLQTIASKTTVPPGTDASARTRAVSHTFTRVLVVIALIGVIAFVFAPWRHFGQSISRIEPYSSADRRMTFAVVPLSAPAGDARAGEAAHAMTELVQAALEENPWAQTTAAPEVRAALARATAPRDLAHALNVHFLFRGTVTQLPAGYHTEISILDGNTERALGSKSVAIPANALTPTRPGDVGAALGGLIYYALRAEVERAQRKPESDLDVRDLTYRAWAGWGDFYSEDSHKGYQVASALLARALALAPDDRLALRLTATINLCECVESWSAHPEQQRQLAAAAITRYLRSDPTGDGVQYQQAKFASTEGRWQDTLVYLDGALRRHPDRRDALELKAVALVKTGRAAEAVPIADELVAREPDTYSDPLAIASAVHYAVGDYAAAARLAERAIALLRPSQQASPNDADVRLTLIAAEAQLGHDERARRALADFHAAVPAVKTMSDVHRWLKPYCVLEGFGPLYAGLARAGMPD